MKLAASVFAILLAPAVAQVPPAAAPAQPKAIPSATGTQRMFSDMGILETNAIVDEIRKQELPAIFRAMLDAGRVEHDGLKQNHLHTVFAASLRSKKPSPEFLEQMLLFLNNTSNSDDERLLLIGALDLAATRETVDFLIRVATTAKEQMIREAAGSFASVTLQGGPELSPLLERVWSEAGEPYRYVGAAMAMAKFGTPRSIELLLSAALATDDRDKDRYYAARDALEKVYLGTAVPPLAARLAGQSPTSEAAQLIVPVLARNIDASASQAVVGWLQGRSENAAPLILDYMLSTTGDPLKSAWADALDPSVPFRNEENRKAIREAIAAYRAGRTSVPPK